MPTLSANGIEIYYEQIGTPGDRPLLLISGLGAQIVGWSSEFLAAIAARGFLVTVYDNRDVGLSSWFDHVGPVDPRRILTREDAAPYLLSDMAADGAELVRELGLGRVDVVGVSMGGMIAQQFVIDHPELTRSLTSIMSSPDIASVGQPTEAAAISMMTPRSDDIDTFLDQEVASWRLTAGSKYELDEEWVRAQALAAIERARHPDGVTRHMAAVAQSPDRRPGLSSVRVPTVVIHGDEDPLVTPSGGEATAQAIPGARYVVLTGVGHSLPREVWDEVIDEIDAISNAAN